MTRTATKAAAAAVLALALIGTSGCVLRREPISRSGEKETRHESVAREHAEHINLDISMGAGRIELIGDELGDDAVVGDFTYSSPRLRPRMESELSGDTLDVITEHRETGVLDFGLGRQSSEWDLRVAKGVPVDLHVMLGAGEGELDLSEVDVRDLRMETGAGRVTVDLSGERAENVLGQLHTGAGEVIVRLPSDIGVRVFGYKDGVGEWNHDGFHVSGDHLVNDAYGDTEATIELNIQRGVGEVTLELDD